MPRVINMLTNLQTAEISMVRTGANNKRIALTKESEMPFADLLKNVLATEAEGEDNLIKQLKSAGVEGDDLEAAIAHYRVQHGFKDMVSKDAFAEIAKAAGYSLKAKKQEDEEEEMKQEEDEDEDKPFPGAAKPFKGKKKTSKSHTPVDMPEEMQSVFKAQQRELDAVRKEAAAANARAEKVEKEAHRKEVIAKCAAEYAMVPGKSAEEMADMLIKAEDTDPAFAKALEEQWTATAAAVSKSELFTTRGAAQPRAGAGAWDQIVTKAREMVRKDANLTEPQAVDMVMQQEPELYQQYLADNPSQLGR